MAIRNLGTLLPAWTRLEWKDGGIDNWKDGGIANREAANKWSGRAPPPPVGATVVVGVSRIGVGKVLGYFEEEGFLGVVVLPANPPDWYVKQNGRNAICHVFGAELMA